MTEAKLSWEEAFVRWPELPEQWRMMNDGRPVGDHGATYRLGPHMHPSDDPSTWPAEPWLLTATGGNVFLEVRSTLSHFPCDPEPIEWHYPPSWRYWGDGNWTCPIPLTMGCHRSTMRMVRGERPWGPNEPTDGEP